MRLKPFIAASMSEAFALVRQELGADAVIIDTENLPDGKVKLTAAVEEDDFFFTEEEEVETLPERRTFDDSLLRECLEYHGVLETVKEKILAMVRQINRKKGIVEDKALLESCFAEMFKFKNLLNRDNPLKLFMGVPGSGKSTAVAKAATLARFKGLTGCIISTDNVRAGANSQLKAFAEILETPFHFVADAKSLYKQAGEAAEKYDLVFIDTPGINPFLPGETAKVSRFTEAVKADMFLTMDAGKNPHDAVEIADIFASMGASCLLPTRLDLTRRIGTLLSVAECTGLSFCAAGVSAQIAQGLADIDAASLAKLVLA